MRQRLPRCTTHRTVPLAGGRCPQCTIEADLLQKQIARRSKQTTRRVLATVAGVPIWLNKKRSHWSDEK